MPSPGAPGAAGAGQGEVLGHATWHPKASADAAAGASGPGPDGGSTSLHNSPERASRQGAARKKSGFNMKASYAQHQQRARCTEERASVATSVRRSDLLPKHARS